jgi:uncharacterized protein YhhL (DUF1145 family)
VWLKSRLLLFIGKTIGFFIVIAIVWHFIAPSYDSLLAKAANQLAPAQTTISYEKNTIYVFPEISTGRPGVYGIEPLDLQYGLLLVIALIAATPGLRLRQRFKFIPIAFVIMFIIHVASILVFANATRSETPASIGSNPFVILFGIFGADLFPVLVWGILSFRYFLPRSQESPVPKMQPRPEGKKHRV